MKVIQSNDNLVTKYIHDNGAETTIKSVNSCNNKIDSETGELLTTMTDRNKFSVFISSSVGCYMKCGFCHLTLKNSVYKKLSEETIFNQVIEAIKHEYSINPSIKEKYLKLCWMGMGDAINIPQVVHNVSLRVIDWVLEKGYAKGLDGVDLSTVLPDVNDSWIEIFQNLNKELEKFTINPNNNKVVQSGLHTNKEVYFNRSLFRLFYSLHEVNQTKRDKIIPNAMRIEKALKKLKQYSQNNKFNLIIHHMFMEGYNDEVKDIEEFLLFLKDNNLTNNEVRILRYNPVENTEYTESHSYADIIKMLASKVEFLKAQVSAGNTINSACGQFYAENRRIPLEIA